MIIKTYLPLCLFVLTGVLFAQEANQGTITGFVYDQSQALVGSAEIKAISQGTGQIRDVKSGTDGVYTIVALQPGVYTVRASARGFKSAEAKEVQLSVGANLRLNFNLEVGAVTDTITVTDVAAALKTESGEVSSLVTGTQVTEIPINGRNFTQFLSLGTGVVSQQTGRQMGLGQEGNPLMGVHGGRISMNKYTYDGTLAMDTGGNRGLDLFPPMEAIGEVKVQKSNYGADAGGFGYGIVNIVTKSGTQQYHGDIYEYFRNDKLDARNFFANDRQLIRLNNFGYTLGGPISIPGVYNTSKTKDFFFWSQSFARRIGPQISSFTTPPTGVFTAQVPTAAQRVGNFAGGAAIRDPSTGQPYPGNIIPAAQIDPNASLLIKTFYPDPNRAGAQNFVHNTRAFTKYREELLRWDHIFSQSWNATARYAQDTWSQDQDVKRPGNSPLPTFPNRFGKPGKNLTTKLTTIATPQAVNLVTFGYSTNAITNAPLGGERPAGLTIPQIYASNAFNRIPDITLANGFAGLGIGDVLINSNPIYTFKDDFSWNKGKQNIKIGVELIRHIKTESSFGGEQGAFNFNGGVTGNGLADFLVGRAFTYTETDADPGITLSQGDYEGYVQDDIKVSQKLTVNVGVRYYIISGSNGGASSNDRISAFVPGLYDPTKVPTFLADGQIVPGTGDPLNGLITGSDRRNTGVGRQLMVTNKDAFGPRVGMAYSLTPKTVIRGGYGINYFWGTATNVPRKSNPPFVKSVNIQNPTLSNPAGGPDRLFPANVSSLDIYNNQPSVQSWSFSIQREVSSKLTAEVSYSGTRGTHLPRGIQLNQADPTRTINANLRRPYLGYGTIGYNENTAVSKYHGLEASLVRRFSGGLLFEASYTYSKGLGHAEGNPLDSRNKNLDFGLIDLDRTHMFSLNYVWEMPFFKGKHGVAPAILGGWQISGITTFQSGLPLGVTQPGDVANFGGGTGGQRPDIVGDPNDGRGASITKYFNTAAFQQVTRTQGIGTSSVRPLRGPGINNFDATLFKNIKPREGMRIQFGAEMFNLFNHAQFEGVGTAMGAATFGVVTDARDPRTIQLRLKMSF
ncbi:MAG: carboxypeptidase-like regulatory domain-containing protein [Acidobacteriota bacterium]